jgi:hypothetical protein
MPSNNDLVSRYLQAVGFWLPRATKNDILAEISEDLHSQLEDRSASLGRPLTEAEVADILKQRGRPAVVAGSFLPQRQLIGPVMFPIYVFVLKIVALCYMVPWLLVWLGFIIFDNSHLIRHAGGALNGLGTFSTFLWIIFGAVTFIFAMLDRTSTRSKFISDWDPRKLPKAHYLKPRNRKREDIGAFVFAILYLAWLTIVPSFPFLIIGPASFFVNAAPVWRTVYPFFLILAVAGVLEPAVRLLADMPAWERPVFRLATNGFSLWVVTILLHAPTYFTAQAQQFQQYASITNLVVSISLTCVSIGLWIGLIVHTFGFVRSLIFRPEPAVPRTA